MRKIFFHFADRNVRLTKTKQIKTFLSEIFKNEKITFERVDYIFCSDNYLLRLNKNFLRRNYFTDILSFELNEQFEPLTGEIYISIDRVLENSRLYKTGFKNEILRVIFHGTLHLCGYKDKRPQDVKIMRQKEDLYLDRFKDYISVSRETPQ